MTEYSGGYENMPKKNSEDAIKNPEHLSDGELKARLHFYRCNNIWDDYQVSLLDELQSRQIRRALAARVHIMDKNKA